MLSIRDVIVMTMIWHDLAQEHRMLTVRQKCDAKSNRCSGNPFCTDLPNYVVEPYARKLNLRYNELARHAQAKFPPAKSPTDKVPADKPPAGEVPAGNVPDGQSSRRQAPRKRSSRRQGPRRTKFPHPGRIPAATDGFKQ